MESICWYRSSRQLVSILLFLGFLVAGNSAYGQAGEVSAFEKMHGALQLLSIPESTETALVPHDCSLTPVAVPSGVDPSCSMISHQSPCTSGDCDNCSLFALQLDCEDCWVEDITFSFDPSDECFFVCGVINLPTHPAWPVTSGRDRICGTTQTTLTSPNPNTSDWVDQGIGVFEICRTSTGSDTLNYMANVLCPNLNDPNGDPIPHGAITGTVSLP